MKIPHGIKYFLSLKVFLNKGIHGWNTYVKFTLIKYYIDLLAEKLYKWVVKNASHLIKKCLGKKFKTTVKKMQFLQKTNSLTVFKKKIVNHSLKTWYFKLMAYLYCFWCISKFWCSFLAFYLRRHFALLTRFRGESFLS